MESQRLVQGARENVGAPSNQRRQRRSPHQYPSYMALMTKLVESYPSSFNKVVEKPIIVDAMVEEYESIVKNIFFEVVPRRVYKLVVGSRWIFKVKNVEDGSIEKYKENFVAKGYSQFDGTDYDETFSPVGRYPSIRSILALTAQMGSKIH